MNIILLSGGSGKRLWPLSNEIQSKQFLKIYQKADGSYESMVQRVYRQIKEVNENASITIATSKQQVASIVNQLGDKVSLSVEPSRKDTFPAIVLAAAYLHDIMKADETETVSVCPVDHFVDVEYYRTVEEISERAKQKDVDLVLMGIEPTYPSDKYGYIIPGSHERCSIVNEFKEKPEKKKAEEYILKGALWNAGVFAFKLSYILNISKEIFGISKYDELINQYDFLNKISFDYAVVEKAKNIQVIRYSGQWRDIGSWSMMTRTMTHNTVGYVILDKGCINTHVINNLDIPLLGMDLKNITVVAGPDGILVATKQGADEIKGYVEKIDQEIKYAEKSWGIYRVLDAEDSSLTIKATIRKKNHMNYHEHRNRDELWTIISGTGLAVINGEKRVVHSGDTVEIPRGCKHTIIAITDLTIIEVQLGTGITVKDKIKYPMPVEL